MVCVDVGCSQSSRTEAAFTQDPDLWNGLGRNQEQSVLFGTGAELVFPFSKRRGKGSPLEKLTSLMVVVAVVVDLSGYRVQDASFLNARCFCGALFRLL